MSERERVVRVPRRFDLTSKLTMDVWLPVDLTAREIERLVEWVDLELRSLSDQV